MEKRLTSTDVCLIIEGTLLWQILNLKLKKELNSISWNDKKPKYDIMDLYSKHKKMGKGITLDVDELKALRDVTNIMLLDSL